MTGLTVRKNKLKTFSSQYFVEKWYGNGVKVPRIPGVATSSAFRFPSLLSMAQEVLLPHAQAVKRKLPMNQPCL
jgi:hypothetical protein